MPTMPTTFDADDANDVSMPTMPTMQPDDVYRFGGGDPVAKLVANLVEHIGLCHTPSWLGGCEPFSKLPPGDRYPACDQPESADSSGPVGLLTTHRLEPKLLLREPFFGISENRRKLM
jgi:hypothetical protein